MSKASRLYIVLKVVLGFFGSINLGISTAFLLQKQITFFELSVIYSLLLGISFVLEYPTGNLADRYGRKFSFALGLFATASQYALYAAASNVFLLYLAGTIGGISDALISGSLEAWLGEEEKRKSPDYSLNYVFGLSRSLTSVFSVVGSLCIGLLVRADLSVIYWIGAAVLAVTSVIAIVILPDNRGDEKATLDFTLGAIRGFIRTPALIFLACVLAGTFACYSAFIIYWQPQAQVYGVSSNQLPLLYSVYLTASAVSSYLYARFAKRIGSSRFVPASFIFIAISFTLMMLGNSLAYLVAGLFSFGLGFGSVFPLFFDWATDIVPSNLRASMLSLMNAIATAVAILATMASGKVVELWGLQSAVYLGLGLSVIILLLLRRLHRRTLSWQTQRAHEEAPSVYLA